MTQIVLLCIAIFLLVAFVLLRYYWQMLLSDLKAAKLPDTPGVYRFLDDKKHILYIGKATSLRSRVRSYFANDLMHTRGKHVVDMVTLATRVEFTQTDSVLEALVLEASLIKRHQPYFNTKEKDGKSWNYVVMSNEDFPSITTLRERTMLTGKDNARPEYKRVFGPFPSGGNLEEALRIVRKIFPFRDTCTPNVGKPCFNRQIGLCPGVCTGEISKAEYAKRLREISLFLEGKKARLVTMLNREMSLHAKKLEFEEAGECKRMIFALRHIKDASLIREEVREESQKSSRIRSKPFRIEAYDVAHISGKFTVGVMTVVANGTPAKSEYRKFKIRINPDQPDDTLHLEEILSRRLKHINWQFPDIIVVDGGVAQKRRAERTLAVLGVNIPVLGVVKDARHKAKAIIGNKELAVSYKRGILVANLESHRFAVEYHRLLRGRISGVGSRP